MRIPNTDFTTAVSFHENPRSLLMEKCKKFTGTDTDDFDYDVHCSVVEPKLEPEPWEPWLFALWNRNRNRNLSKSWN